jgi:MFS family permease
VIAGPLSGFLTDRRGARTVAVAGAAVLTAGLALVAPLGGDWHPLGLAWRLAVVGAGFGLFVTPVQTIALTLAPRELLATASATTNLARQIGMAIGPAIGTAAWAASGYRPAGMRLAIGLAVAVSALAAASLARTPTARAQTSRRHAGRPLTALDTHQ